ncbi:MAG: hypothetical protein CMO80_16245 [Verrucomicrobiales bacterium]|nr:hypothetical protein [Verrucomicrobiales bacterium]
MQITFPSKSPENLVISAHPFANLFNLCLNNRVPELNFSMKATAQRTGLSPHVIRVWEKRYGAVQPNRTQTNRRTYSEFELKRLALLKSAVDAGHAIGSIVQLPDDDLRQLINSSSVPQRAEAITPGQFEDEALAAIQKLDTTALEDILNRCALAFGSKGLLEKVVAPLTRRIGDLWAEGELSAAQEHFASSFIRTFLSNLARPFALDESAPVFVVGTPTGQLHEMGTAIAGAAASSVGWRVINLSVSLPPAEIASAALKARAKVVGLSIVFPSDDPAIVGELEQLRKLLPDEIEIFVGGRACNSYQETIDHIGATRCDSLADVYKELDRVRTSS